MMMMMEITDIISINCDGLNRIIIKNLQKIKTNFSPNQKDELIEKFKQLYFNNLRKRNSENQTDFKKLKLIIIEFQNTLSKIIPTEDVDKILKEFVPLFDVWLDYTKKQVKQFISDMKDSYVNGFNFGIYSLKFFCTKCEEYTQIPVEKRKYIFRSDKSKYQTLHHEKEMELRLIKKPKSKNPDFLVIHNTKALYNKSEFYSEVLLGINNQIPKRGDSIIILSVGIDIGSSTTHLIFSRLTLRRELSFENPTNRYNLSKREILYTSDIIKTPLIDSSMINTEEIIRFITNEYNLTGITRDMVDTGAVIITGETAKKKNAEEIVKKISSTTGKFVSATAGPNFESQLGAFGSGAVKLSSKLNKTIMNIDIGGGTSNIAVIKNGSIFSTSCVNVGGTLLGVYENFKIWRLDEPTKVLMTSFGMKYDIGDIITKEDYNILIHEYARILLEVITKPAETTNAKKLMMTADLEFPKEEIEYSFSGGVAEFIYGKPRLPEFQDIGYDLAKEIKTLCDKHYCTLIEPDNKIRATVIGAGSFSLTISGSTSYVDKNLKLPLVNIPVINIDMIPEEFSIETVISKVKRGFQAHDFIEGEDLIALYFKAPINHSNYYLMEFSKAIEAALPKSIEKKHTVILLFKMDFGRVLGTTIKRITQLKENLICLDELELLPGDWIDIGAQLENREVYPVTIKSLAFY